MKLFFRKSLMLAALLALAAYSAPAEQKFATVSLPKLFDNYWKTKQANAALEDQQAEMKKSESEMEDNWKKTNQDYQKLLVAASDQAVSADERDKRKKDAESRLKDLKEIEANIGQFQRQAAATLQEKKNRMTKNILDEIKLAVAGKAKSAGYTMVFDSETLPYAAPETDISDAVLVQLNAGAPADIPKTGATNDNKSVTKDDKK